MPQEVFKVSQPVGHKDDDNVKMLVFIKLVTELNKALSEISVSLGRVNGRDTAVTKFSNDIDLDGNDIDNVGSINFGSRKHATGTQPFTGVYAIDDPADTPATVDALRDDITDNVLPDIENALNDLGLHLKRVLDVLKL